VPSAARWRPATARVQIESWGPFAEAIFSDPVLSDIGAAHGKSVAQVVLRWLIQRDVIVIPKSVRPERMRENIDVFDFELTDDEMARIAAMDTGTDAVLRPRRPGMGQPAHQRPRRLTPSSTSSIRIASSRMPPMLDRSQESSSRATSGRLALAQVMSTNPLERFNREIGRRIEVVGGLTSPPLCAATATTSPTVGFFPWSAPGADQGVDRQSSNSRPGSRCVTSWRSHPLPSGSLKEAYVR
jgi:Aldo/keto reductase family